MKKILLFVLPLASCSPKLDIPVTDVELTNQQENFILGTSELKVVVTKVKVNPKSKIFTVWGYTDFLVAPNPDYAKHPHIAIKRIADGDTTFYKYTGWYGKFKLQLRSKDTILFDYDQWKILNVYFHYP